MANIEGLREVLNELSTVTKELADSPTLELMTVDDADFISLVTTTIVNIKAKRES